MVLGVLCGASLATLVCVRVPPGGTSSHLQSRVAMAIAALYFLLSKGPLGGSDFIHSLRILQQLEFGSLVSSFV